MSLKRLKQTVCVCVYFSHFILFVYNIHLLFSVVVRPLLVPFNFNLVAIKLRSVLKVGRKAAVKKLALTTYISFCPKSIELH